MVYSVYETLDQMQGRMYDLELEGHLIVSVFVKDSKVISDGYGGRVNTTTRVCIVYRLKEK